MRLFTPEEDQYLREHYMSQTLQEMGKALNRMFGSIYGRMKLLKLELPEDIKEQRRKSGLMHGWQNEDTRFKKGMTPWNKGKKGLQIGGVATQFKKGNLPKNTKEDGAITIRQDKNKHKYQFIRVSKGRWKEYHRYLWEKEYGKLKPTDVIRFKDGNTLNCNIENLEKVTRIENMRLNSVMRYPKEVRDIVRVKAVLTREINKNKNKYEHRDNINRCA